MPMVAATRHRFRQRLTDGPPRLAKLIPAEALGLYGAATGILPPMPDNTTLRLVFLIIIAVICLAILDRRSLQEHLCVATGSPQIWAIIISSVSFVIWLMSLGIPNSPIPIPQELAFIPTIIARDLDDGDRNLLPRRCRRRLALDDRPHQVQVGRLVDVHRRQAVPRPDGRRPDPRQAPDADTPSRPGSSRPSR